MSLEPLPITPQTRVRRLAEYQRTEREALYSVLDAALVATVSLVRDDKPVALPVGFARDEDSILLHGSTGSDFFRRIASGAALCVNITHLDGLEFARSLFDSSMRYRAAVIHGSANVVDGDAKEAALLTLSEHLMPGRALEVRPMTKRELAATLVLRIPLDAASVKDNTGFPLEESADDGEDHAVWAGILPLHQSAGTPERSALTTENTPVPPSVANARARFAPNA